MMLLEAIEASDREGNHEYRDPDSIGMGVLREKPSCALWKGHKDTHASTKWGTILLVF